MKLIAICRTIFLAGLLLISCSPETAYSIESANAGIPRAPVGLGVDLGNMDSSIRPQDNFYRYINGRWLEETEIPSDRARWGSFDELREQAEADVLAIIREAVEQEAEEGTQSQKIGDMFRAFMDTLRIEELGIQPMTLDLMTIDTLSSRSGLAAYFGYSHSLRQSGPVAIYVGQDLQQADRNITYATQSGLGLPDRDYYLNDDDQSKEIRHHYLRYIQNLWAATDWADGDRAGERIMKLETALAEIQWTRVENRDRQATYNRMYVSGLTESASGFDWLLFLDHAGLDIEELVVRQPTYLKGFAEIWGDFDLDDWKTYLRFHLLRRSASLLSSDFDQAHFEFYGRVLSGQEEQREREKRAVSAVENSLGFITGKLYIDRHFPQEASDRMDEMIENLMIAFEQSIKDLEWMTDETKKEALAKLSTFNTKIGFPDVWRDYDCLRIRPDDLIYNLRNTARCEYVRNISRLGQEVDRDEWHMTPQTVNAYYSVTMNEIVFPAAILQPPFFDVEADNAVNYGAIGAVIGHEISHGFDDQGRRSDGDGNLRDWWTEEDEEQFQARAQLMIDQYNEFNPVDDMYINGELALGENIADLGGVNVAYRAYLNSLGGEEPPVIEGFTGQQRFFMGWGQIWRIKFRDEALRRQLITGPHSPGKYRVIGILSNMPEFYDAFDVRPGDEMYRNEEERVRIW